MSDTEGKWIKAGKLHGRQLYQCTSCLCLEAVPETVVDYDTVEPVWEWCPNCGVKMRKGNNVLEEGE